MKCMSEMFSSYQLVNKLVLHLNGKLRIIQMTLSDIQKLEKWPISSFDSNLTATDSLTLFDDKSDIPKSAVRNSHKLLDWFMKAQYTLLNMNLLEIGKKTFELKVPYLEAADLGANSM